MHDKSWISKSGLLYEIVQYLTMKICDITTPSGFSLMDAFHGLPRIVGMVMLSEPCELPKAGGWVRLSHANYQKQVAECIWTPPHLWYWTFAEVITSSDKCAPPLSAIRACQHVSRQLSYSPFPFAILACCTWKPYDFDTESLYSLIPATIC